jgi:hypothetical protein
MSRSLQIQRAIAAASYVGSTMSLRERELVALRLAHLGAEPAPERVRDVVRFDALVTGERSDVVGGSL